MAPSQVYFIPQPMPSRFYTLGRLMYRYRRWTIAVWLLLVVASLVVIPQLETVLQETGSVYDGGRTHQAEQLLQQDLNVTADVLTVVFQRRPGQSAPSQPAIEPLVKEIQALPTVDAIDCATEHPEYRSADGQVQYCLIRLTVSAVRPTIDAIEQIEHSLTRTSLPGWESFLTGVAVVNRDVQKISQVDLSRIELLVLPLTLVALLSVFGSAIAAILPVVMAIVTVSITFGLLYLLALYLSVSVFALNLVSMLGLGLGIDYSLLMVNRFREELDTGSRETAIARTVETAGRAVFFSGSTVCIGLMGLLLFPITLLQSLGIAGALVVLLSVVVALTLLPALLGLVGQRVQRRSPPRCLPTLQLNWATIARRVIRHSVPATIVVLVIVSGLTAPFLKARFGLPSADILPQEFPARKGADILSQAFGAGEISPVLLLLRTTSSTETILAKQHIATLHDTVQRLNADPRVARVTSLFSLDPTLPLAAYEQLDQELETTAPSQLTAVMKLPDRKSLFLFRSQTAANQKQGKGAQFPLLAGMKTWIMGRSSTLVVIKSRTARNSSATQALVKAIQAWKLEGLEVWVAGATAQDLDTIAIIVQRIPIVLLIMMGFTFVILYLLFQSVILPLKAIVMNVLSIGASFGALVFIFQDGNFQEWLHFTPVGYIDLLLPIVLFCLLFGLSMDYEVFLLTRIKESYDQGKSNAESIIEGLELTGSIITSAALLMIIVTSTFVLSRIIFVKALGLGCALSVLVDVTLIRVILVPATMHLLGKWNWWSPRWKW